MDWCGDISHAKPDIPPLAPMSYSLLIMQNAFNTSLRFSKLGAVALIYKPNCSDVEVGGKFQSRQKIHKTPSQPVKAGGGPNYWEALVGGSHPGLGLSKNVSPYLKNKQRRKKSWEHGSNHMLPALLG
jgi:hypothetical protein